MPDRFERFAVYFAPAPHGDMARAGAAWLGWDADAGQAVPHPDLGVDLAALTETPRKYGLHGTLTPPMWLDCGAASFLDAVDTLAQGLAPVDMGRLRLHAEDGWLALVPEVQPEALTDCAARIVEALAPLRAPLSESELARRRAAGLSARQDELLILWGYPYVMEEFRFHITLTGKLAHAELERVVPVAQSWFGPLLGEAHMLDALSVFGEDGEGRFHLLRRYALLG